MKMEKETFDVLVKQVKDAVIEDLTFIDPTRTILKARIWCRDDEDQFDLYCLYDFGPYMDMLLYVYLLNRMLQNGSGSNMNV